MDFGNENEEEITKRESYLNKIFRKVLPKSNILLEELNLQIIDKVDDTDIVTILYVTTQILPKQSVSKTGNFQLKIPCL
jgi:hypothetical protein